MVVQSGTESLFTAKVRGYESPLEKGSSMVADGKFGNGCFRALE